MAIVPAMWHGQYIIKQLDEATGYFYYTNQNTGETYWDKPAGVDIALRSADPPRQQVEETLRQREIAALDRRERQELIGQQLVLRRKAKAERDRAAEEAERERIDGLWREAEEHACRKRGHFSLCWHRLGAVSPRLYTFPTQHPGVPLVTIALVGQALTQVPPELLSSRPIAGSLTSLSLAANLLTVLPEDLCQLTNLRELNLLGNAIRELPQRIGVLVHLHKLEIAGNKLQTLPPSFGNLTKLKRVVLDCNKIKTLPETLGTLRCTHLSISCNRLAALPRCVKDMPRLRELLVNDNGLKALPTEIGMAPQLQILSVCGNRLTQLPDSICWLSLLQKLWLDHNFMTGLPLDFHRLEALQQLKLEGNRHMVYPGPETVVAGVDAVRRWCKRRFNDRIHSRRHTLVLTVQDALQQVAKFGLANPAYFEPDVRVMANGTINMAAVVTPTVTPPGSSRAARKPGSAEATEAAAAAAAAMNKLGDMYYALVWDKFWEEMLPALEKKWGMGDLDNRGHVTSFSYTRDEVDAVLKEYRDPLGRVMRTQAVMFRRCACRHPETGRRRVCVPPRMGWMCERQATLIRRTIILEREQMERQRAKQEEKDIAFRVGLARKVVKEYSESEEGRLHYQELAIKKAEQLMRERAAGEHKNEADALLSHRLKLLNQKFDKEQAKATKAKELRIKDMKDKLHAMELQCESLRGWALEQQEAKMEQMTKLMQHLPEDDALAEIEVRRKAAHEEAKGRADTATSKATKKLLSKKVQRNDKEFLELVAELLADSIRNDMDREGEAARRSGIDEHVVLRRVMGLWLGMGMREVFTEWKAWTKRRIRLRRHDARKELRQAWQQYETNSVAMEMARWNVSKWSEQWDDYQDLPFWVHATTGVIRWDAPAIQEYLPPGYEEPTPPSQRLEDLSDSESDWSGSGSGTGSGSEGSSYDSDSGSGGSASGSEAGGDDVEGAQPQLEGAPQPLLLENGSAPAAEYPQLQQGADGGMLAVAMDGTLVPVPAAAAAAGGSWGMGTMVPASQGAVGEYTGQALADGSMEGYFSAMGSEVVPYVEQPDALRAATAEVEARRAEEARRARRRAKMVRTQYMQRENKERNKRAEARAEAARSGSISTPLRVEEAMEVVGYNREGQYDQMQMTLMATQALDVMLKQHGDLHALDKFGFSP